MIENIYVLHINVKNIIELTYIFVNNNIKRLNLTKNGVAFLINKSIKFFCLQIIEML